MRRWAAAVPLVALALVAAACEPRSLNAPSATGAPSTTRAEPVAFATPSDAVAVDGGCGETYLWRGSVPPALDAATGHNAPRGLPVAIARPAILAGFIFGHPLRAGHPENPSNKVLWVVATGRFGALVVEAHPLDAPAPLVRSSFRDDSGPGNIYPSAVDVPYPGCWHLTFAWEGGTAEMDLLYR